LIGEWSYIVAIPREPFSIVEALRI
jgi:hypothetical protein